MGHGHGDPTLIPSSFRLRHGPAERAQVQSAQRLHQSSEAHLPVDSVNRWWT